MTFEYVKEGDTVTRMICGIMPMELKVTKVDDKLIHCGDWTFDRVTGAEVDEELGWTAHQTGSVLKQ
jgi:hypothetical protein